MNSPDIVDTCLIILNKSLVFKKNKTKLFLIFNFLNKKAKS